MSILCGEAIANGVGVPEVIESAESDGEAIVSGSESVDQRGIAQAFNQDFRLKRRERWGGRDWRSDGRS